jgi:hypothetical protein
VLWAAIIGWILVVGASLTLVGVRGFSTYRQARSAEGMLREQVQALEQGGLVQLAEKTAELQRRIAELHGVFERLARSLEVLRVLLAAWNTATGPARAVLRFVRR